MRVSFDTDELRSLSATYRENAARLSGAKAEVDSTAGSVVIGAVQHGLSGLSPLGDLASATWARFDIESLANEFRHDADDLLHLVAELEGTGTGPRPWLPAYPFPRPALPWDPAPWRDPRRRWLGPITVLPAPIRILERFDDGGLGNFIRHEEQMGRRLAKRWLPAIELDAVCVGRSAVSGAFALMAQAAGTAKKGWDWIVGRVKTISRAVWNSVAGAVSQAFRGVRDYVGGCVAKAVSVYRGVRHSVQTVGRWIHHGIDNTVHWGQHQVHNIKKWAHDRWNSICRFGRWSKQLLCHVLIDAANVLLHSTGLLLVMVVGPFLLPIDAVHAFEHWAGGRAEREAIRTSLDRLDHDISGMPNDPVAVKEWWNRLTASQRAALIDGDSARIGNTDGIPVDDRYRANCLAARRYLAELRRIEPDPKKWPPHARKLDELLRDGKTHQLLLWDPRGDGRIAIVNGNLNTAKHVGVVVPGIGNDQNSFDFGRNDASALYGAGGDTATIQWLGYDAPPGIDHVPGVGDLTQIMGADRARSGAAQLQSFVAGLRATSPGADITVIAHSYGSVVASEAARGGLAADKLVFIGSPGVHLDHASDAKLYGGSHAVFVGKSPEDPVSFITGGSVPNIEGLQQQWHGTNPTDPDFGAEPFPVQEEWPWYSHGRYYQGISLENLQRILHRDIR